MKFTSVAGLLALSFVALGSEAVAQTASGSIIRTFVHHEISAFTSGPGDGGRQAPVLSANGNKVAYGMAPGTGDPARPNRIFTMNSDGSGQVQVDSYTTWCYCGSMVDISADGSKVISTEAMQLRIANGDGSGARSLVAIDSNEISDIRISGDGTKVFFLVYRDTSIRGSSPSVSVPRGLWVINADGSGMRRIVSPSQFASQLGIASDTYCCFGPGSPGLGVSTDGSRIVFLAFNNAVSGGAGQGLFGVNLDSSGLRDLVGRQSFFMYAGLSADGSKAGYAFSDFSGGQEAGAVNFNGTGRRKLTDSTVIHPTGYSLGDSGDRLYLSSDGSKLLLGSTSLLFDTATGAGLQVAARGGWWSTDPPPILYDGMFRASMNGSATRFLYVAGDANGIRQLATMDVNPASLGQAPAIANPAIVPAYVLLNGASSFAITARVTTSNTLIHVSNAALLNGLDDNNVDHDVMFDDGTNGDKVAGDGIFTNSAIRANCCAAIGPRTARVKAEVRSSDGKRHATAIDFGTFFVVSQLPGAAPGITAVNPASATAGTQVTITGSGFDSTAANDVVSFGGQPAQVISANSTTLVVVVPAGLPPGATSLAVAALGQTSNAVSFTIVVSATLAVAPAALNLSATTGAASTSSILQISSTGGAVNWSASVRLLSGSNWLTLSPASGASSASQPGTIAVQINYSALTTAGSYQAVIAVTDTATSYVVAVPVTVALSSAGGRLSLSQTAFVFTAAQGGAVPPPQTLRLSNAGPGSVSWSVPSPGSLTPAASWLGFSAQSGTAGSDPTQPASLTLSANPAGLAAGVYQALAPISAPGASNTPALIAVTLLVVPSATPPLASLSATGLVFVASQGGSAPAAQTVTVSNAGGGTLSFQFAPSAVSGGAWLSVTPASGNAPGGGTPVQVAVNPTGLAVGLYRGKLTGTFSSGAAQEIEVVLLVVPGASPAGPVVHNMAFPIAAAACVPGSIELVATTVGNGGTLSVSFPRVLLALVVDSCGNAVANATVVASADGANIVLQALGNGLYSGTWVPERASSAITVNFVALHPSFSAASRKSYTVSTAAAAGSAQLPNLFADGVVEGAGFTPRRPLAPGGIISLFGARLAAAEASASRLPLDRQLGGVTVTIGGQNAPLYYVSAGQINAQVPFEAGSSSIVTVAVNAGGRLTAPQNYLVAPAQPGIFRAGGNAAILDSANRLVTPDNPARIGDTLQIFATGLGAVDVPVDTGVALNGASSVRNPVTVAIGGVSAAVVYQGLAPGFVGLYQVNVVVPDSVAPGDLVPLVLTQNGITSNPDAPLTIPVRAR